MSRRRVFTPSSRQELPQSRAPSPQRTVIVFPAALAEEASAALAEEAPVHPPEEYDLVSDAEATLAEARAQSDRVGRQLQVFERATATVVLSTHNQRARRRLFTDLRADAATVAATSTELLTLLGGAITEATCDELRRLRLHLNLQTAMAVARLETLYMANLRYRMTEIEAERETYARYAAILERVGGGAQRSRAQGNPR